MKANEEKNGKKYEKNPPEVGVVRFAKDVQAMMALAKKDGFGENWSQIVNRALRHRLSQEYLTKRVSNIQDKMRIAGIPIS